MQRITILGATGSIGVSTLDVLARHPEKYAVYALSAHSRVDELAYRPANLLQRLREIIRERFWDRCTLFDVNFRPKNMTVAQLEEGLYWLFGEIYNEREYIRRQRRYMEIVKERMKDEG